MSREVPPLPDKFFELAQDIQEELMCFEHILRTHGERGCYTAGCRGPLCKRADRIYNREHYKEQRKAAGKKYEPSDLRRDDREDELAYAQALYVVVRPVLEIHVRLTQLYAEIENGLA